MRTLSLACLTGSCFLGVLLFFYWKNNFINPVYQAYADGTLMSTSTPDPDFLFKSHAAISSGDIALPVKSKAENITTANVFMAPISTRFLLPAPVVTLDYTTVKNRIGNKRLVKKINPRRLLLATIVSPLDLEVAKDVAIVTETKREPAHTPLPAEEVTAAAAPVTQPEDEAEVKVLSVQRIADVAPEAAAAENNVVTHRSLTVAAEVKTEKKAKSFYVPSYMATRQAETGTNNYSYMALYDRAEKLKEYAEQHGYDTEYAFVLDMGMKSGKKRFFVVDMASMTIVKSGLVAHGRGDERFTFDKKYSNRKGSNCSSLGIYKVGKFYNGAFGPSYRLIGLQESNSNATQRAIVLHGMNCIPYEESDFPVCQSEGCPSLSPEFLKELKPIIDGRAKPMLLWMFDSTKDANEQ